MTVTLTVLTTVGCATVTQTLLLDWWLGSVAANYMLMELVVTDVRRASSVSAQTTPKAANVSTHSPQWCHQCLLALTWKHTLTHNLTFSALFQWKCKNSMLNYWERVGIFERSDIKAEMEEERDSKEIWSFISPSWECGRTTVVIMFY